MIFLDLPEYTQTGHYTYLQNMMINTVRHLLFPSTPHANSTDWFFFPLYNISQQPNTGTVNEY